MFKVRTMHTDAEARLPELQHLSEVVGALSPGLVNLRRTLSAVTRGAGAY
jgi:hypothetical protein